jgi:hypothetical protein
MLLFSSASKILLFKSVGRKHTKKSYMNLKEDEISVSRRMPKKRMLLVQFESNRFRSKFTTLVKQRNHNHTRGRDPLEVGWWGARKTVEGKNIRNKKKE